MCVTGDAGAVGENGGGACRRSGVADVICIIARSMSEINASEPFRSGQILACSRACLRTSMSCMPPPSDLPATGCTSSSSRLCARPPSAHTNAGRPRAGARWLLRSDHGAQLLAYLCVHPEIFGCEPPKPTSCARSSDVCIATEDGFLLAAFASATRKPPAVTRLPSPIVPPDRPLRSSLSRTRATLGTPPAHIGLSSKSPAPDWGRTPACVGLPHCCAGGPSSFSIHNTSPPARSSLALSFAPPCCHPRRTAPAHRIARCARSPRTNACIKFAPSI